MPQDDLFHLASINRVCVTIIARQHYIDWLESLPERAPGEKFSLDLVNSDNTAYLVPAFEDNSKVLEYVGALAPTIFEEQLESWYTDETNWPKNRDWKTFLEWFDIRIHTMAFDFCDEPLC